MPKPDNTLDEILTSLENAVQRDMTLRFGQHRAGVSPKVAHADAKQAILQWVADEVVGANPPEPSEYASDEEFAYYRGQFLARDKQHDILRAHGWKERDDE